MRIPAPRPIQSGFVFQNVSFAYPGSARLVLNNVSFQFDAHERIALIGENGAGKTTMVKLLARLVRSNGRCHSTRWHRLAGVLTVEILRKEIGVIFQDYMRFDMSAADNIGFGQIEELTEPAAD